MKIEEKFKAIKLRKQGKSYNEILKKVSVTKSTLSLWLRDIPLSKEQRSRLKGRQISRLAGAKANQRKRIEKTKKIIQKAKVEARKLFKNPLFLTGLMIYWAEGTKGGTTVNLSNSDPTMIKLMMKWFRETCYVPEKKFRIQIHMHALHCRPKIEKYWSNVTKIPLEQFQKTFVKPTSLRQRKNKLYNGTCCIRICSADLLRKIIGWRLGTLERLGFLEKYIIK